MACKKGSQVRGKCVPRLYHFSLSDGVIDVGTRLDLVKHLPSELDIRADNNVDDSEVDVYLSGNENSIRGYYDLLQHQKLGRARDYRFSGLSESKECPPLDSNRFFHKLECEQLGKFVDVGLGMQSDMKAMSYKMNELTNISSKLGELTAKMGELIEVTKEGRR
jgi:hypothetical protein